MPACVVEQVPRVDACIRRVGDCRERGDTKSSGAGTVSIHVVTCSCGAVAPFSATGNYRAQDGNDGNDGNTGRYEHAGSSTVSECGSACREVTPSARPPAEVFLPGESTNQIPRPR
ncbi:hypothetical protein I545_1513 [Mycobacterium kansasii 662]|uniref:Uncharacterized protein n=1 Tax=Mycobacterium kansasii 662 TaxID=1299326 RepID=X7ZQW3_MYCKA|nr:hypothetical protein I545_1513 [Mycobacterium kansasii 662]KEP42466.1 hypothetical protein MKSMC1_23960 [Mycobacterium kansasii]